MITPIVPMHVEEAGRGSTVHFLHGAAECIGYADAFVGLLAERHRVVQAERRGHGRTPDAPGPITYDAMAADTVALLERDAGTPAHLVGYSDGGIVALLVAIARPKLVASVVAIGANARVDGLTAEALAWLADVTPETWPHEAFEAYARRSPDGPGHWPVVCAKIRDLLLREPDIPASDLARIEAPTLVLGGDRDVIRLDHLLELHASIPGAQLCILPGTPHEIPVERPELAARVVLEFLAQGGGARVQ